MRRRYIQDPETGKLVLAEEYIPRQYRVGPDILPDISKPFVTDDGRRLTSRSQVREYMRTHNKVPVHEMRYIQQDIERHRRERKQADDRARKREVIRRVNAAFEKRSH